MDLHRFAIQILVVAGTIGLVVLVALFPETLSDKALDIVETSLAILWTLVAFIVRDARNRST